MSRRAYQEQAAQLLTITQAAEQSGISKSKLYKLVHSNALASELVDGILHIAPSALHAYQREQRRDDRETPVAGSKAWRTERARMGGLARAAQYSSHDLAAQVQTGKRRAAERAAERAVDPTGRLRQVAPAEFERRVAAHQSQQLAGARLAKAGNEERRQVRRRQQQQYYAASNAAHIAATYHSRW